MSLLQTFGGSRYRIRRGETHIVRPSSPRPQRRDCQGQLLAALAAMTGPGCAVEDAGMRPWCSATFVGAQHRIMLRLSGDDAAQRAATLRATLGEADFALRGHIVADLSVDEASGESDGTALVSLSALTIEDW